jgi:hypothetical protein
VESRRRGSNNYGFYTVDGVVEGWRGREGGVQETWLQQLWLLYSRWGSGGMEREGRWSPGDVAPTTVASIL